MPSVLHNPDPDLPIDKPAAVPQRTFDLRPTRRLVTLTVCVVLGLHMALLLWMGGERITDRAQRPDMQIEFISPPPSTSPTSSPAPAPATPPLRGPVTSPAPSLAAPLQPPAPTAQVPLPPTPSDQTPPAPKQASAAPAATQVLPSALTSEADYQAAELNNPKPLYPLRAIREEAQGRVLLLVEVLPDGRAGRIALEKSSGHAILDASAMNTVQRWRFKPAQQDGAWVSQTIRIPIDFTLKDRR
jgi:periplasmic protein TonB